MTMNNFCDPAAQTIFIEPFAEWGYTREQATLYASVIFSKNDASSAERVIQSVNELTVRSVRGDMQETWEFRDDLTYEHKYESYEGMSSRGRVEYI